MRFLQKVKKGFNLWRKKYLDFSPLTYKLLWAFLFFVLISLTLSLDLIPNQVDLEAGQVSQTDITAPRTMTFIDDARTEELKDRASENAPRVYEEDSIVESEIKNKVKLIFASIIEERETILENKLQKSEQADDQSSDSLNQDQENDDSTGTPASDGENIKIYDLTKLTEEDKSKIIKNVNQNLSFELSADTLGLLIMLPKEELAGLREKINDLLSSELSQRILPSELSTSRSRLRQSAMELDISRDKRLVVSEIAEKTIEANMFLNTEATQRRRADAVSEVEPVQRTVRQGEIIVRKGDVVTDTDIQILERFGLQKSGLNYYNITGRVLITFITIFLLGFYFYKYKKEIWEDNSKLLLIEMLIFSVILLSKIFTFFNNPFVDYLIPTAMAAILLTVLIDSDTALIAVVFTSILAAPIYDMNFNIVLVSLLAGLVGIYSTTKVKERGDIIRAGLNVSLLLVFLIGGLSLLQQNQDWYYLVWAIGGGITNGLLVGVLANGVLPYLEDLFDMTSSVKLLELANPSQPILKRMLVEAPGTYHHSIIVGNLAETAAEDIGADSLLARAATYYHDIGKLKRPYFFSENQFGGENPHDKTSPNLSALIIKSHVKDGVELAEKHGLPTKIIDIIKQHHGTNLISYFYQQALEENKHDDIEKKDFRYDGPKPQSREAAIIMLADITEAALRSKKFNKNNHDRIEGVVRGLIKDKLIENQLDKSDLTLTDLDTIAKSFVKVLTGIYHQRVEYPEKLLTEMKGSDKID
jgi:hypothetical protein